MRKSAEVREKMFKQIEEWQQSGLTQKAFCGQHSLEYHTFYYWYKCYRRRQAGANENIASFVKLKIEKPVGVGSVEIYSPGGFRLIFHEPVSATYLKALLG
ncbi:MAG: IS66 family insertion sequence element accessory protein TnpA [Chitinophagaceae bacterium]